MIRQTQDQWLDSSYIASSVEGGLPEVDFCKIAQAYGFHAINISKNNQINKAIDAVFKKKGPVFCNVEISHNHRVNPQVKYGRPNEDPEPLLKRREFLKNMLVKAWVQPK